MKLATITYIAIMTIALLAITHTTIGIYNDNTVSSFGMGNTHLGFSIGQDNGKLFYNYHIN